MIICPNCKEEIDDDSRFSVVKHCSIVRSADAWE